MKIAGYIVGSLALVTGGVLLYKYFTRPSIEKIDLLTGIVTYRNDNNEIKTVSFPLTITNYNPAGTKMDETFGEYGIFPTYLDNNLVGASMKKGADNYDKI